MSEGGTVPGFGDWDVFDGYSRADAVADGAPVEVPAAVAAEAGFTCPVALTRAGWEDCVAWDAADSARKGTIEDQDGRLRDVLWMASLAGRRLAAEVRADFTVYRVPRPGTGRKPRPARLVSHVGPGDAGELVVTGLMGRQAHAAHTGQAVGQRASRRDIRPGGRVPGRREAGRAGTVQVCCIDTRLSQRRKTACCAPP